jgi:hypothetical protein
VDCALNREKFTAFVDEVVVDDGIVVDDLVARRQDKYLLLLPHPLSLRNQDLDVSQRLAGRIISSFVAQGYSLVLVGEGGRHLEGDPFGVGLLYKIDFINGWSVLFTEANLKVDALCEVDEFVSGAMFLGNFREHFKTGNPFLF